MQAMTESIKKEFIENAAEIGIDLNDKMLSSFDLYYTQKKRMYSRNISSTASQSPKLFHVKH